MRVLDRHFYDLNYSTAFTSKSHLLKTLKDKVSRREVEDWADRQPLISKYSPATRRFPRLKVFAHRHDDIWSMDFCSLISQAPHNNNYKYFAVVVDALSRKTYTFNLRTRKPEETIEQLKKLFKIAKPRVALITDVAGEFRSKAYVNFLKENGIQAWYTRNDEIKTSLSEHRIKIIMSRLTKYMVHNNTKVWYKVINRIVDNVNETFMPSIGTKPNAVKTLEDDRAVFKKLYGKYLQLPSKPSAYKENDRVRISHLREKFRKGYNQTFSEETFNVKKIIPKGSINLLSLEDDKKETLVGRFYPREVRAQK
jgi:hypothetical protein